MRSPVTSTVDVTKNPGLPTLPGLPTNMTRSILENIVAAKFRENLTQKMEFESKNPTPALPMPFQSGLGHLNPLMPFGQFPGLGQANQALTGLAQVNPLMQAQQNVALNAANNVSRDTSTLYQPAVKRRRRGYGSEVIVHFYIFIVFLLYFTIRKLIQPVKNIFSSNS